MRRLVEEAGLEPVEIRYVNPFGAVGWLIASRVYGATKCRQGRYERMTAYIPVLRRLDLLRLPFGLSLWTRARRVS